MLSTIFDPPSSPLASLYPVCRLFPSSNYTVGVIQTVYNVCFMFSSLASVTSSTLYISALQSHMWRSNLWPSVPFINISKRDFGVNPKQRVVWVDQSSWMAPVLSYTQYVAYFCFTGWHFVLFKSSTRCLISMDLTISKIYIYFWPPNSSMVSLIYSIYYVVNFGIPHYS